MLIHTRQLPASGGSPAGQETATQACAAVYLSASNTPQTNVSEATSSTGSNEAVAAPEPQVTDLTAPNSALSLSTPDTRKVTLPLHVDEGVKVIATLSRLVPLAVTAVHRLPTLSPAGDVVRYTSAHLLPSDELLADALAVAVVDAVGRLEAVTLLETLGAAEASADPPDPEVAAEATATPKPIVVSSPTVMIAPLPRVRLRMIFPSSMSCYGAGFRKP